MQDVIIHAIEPSDEVKYSFTDIVHFFFFWKICELRPCNKLRKRDTCTKYQKFVEILSFDTHIEYERSHYRIPWLLLVREFIYFLKRQVSLLWLYNV